MEMSLESFKESFWVQPRTMGTNASDAGGVDVWDQNSLDVKSAHALKNIFFYLSLIFRYPTEQVYSEIKGHREEFSGFFADYGGAVPDLPPIDDLQSEYISLFVTSKGFIPAAPYASCYQGDGLLMGEHFHRLRQIMMASGFMMDASVLP